MSAKDIYQIACAAVGVEPPRFGVPIKVMAAMGPVSALVARLRRRDTRLSPLTVRLMHVMSSMNHDKAVDELGWRPRPTSDGSHDVTSRPGTTGGVSRDVADVVDSHR